jgi:hypothetical protein
MADKDMSIQPKPATTVSGTDKSLPAAKPLPPANEAEVKDTLLDCGKLDLNALPLGFWSPMIQKLQLALVEEHKPLKTTDGTLTQETKDAFSQWQAEQREADKKSQLPKEQWFLHDNISAQQSWARFRHIKGYVKPGRELLGQKPASATQQSSSFDSGPTVASKGATKPNLTGVAPPTSLQAVVDPAQKTAGGATATGAPSPNGVAVPARSTPLDNRERAALSAKYQNAAVSAGLAGSQVGQRMAAQPPVLSYGDRRVPQDVQDAAMRIANDRCVPGDGLYFTRVNLKVDGREVPGWRWFAFDPKNGRSEPGLLDDAGRELPTARVPVNGDADVAAPAASPEPTPDGIAKHWAEDTAQKNFGEGVTGYKYEPI